MHCVWLTGLCGLVVMRLLAFQVKVSRIHVRYEDPVTNANTKFSVGMTLDNLELKVVCSMQPTLRVLYMFVCECTCVCAHV